MKEDIEYMDSVLKDIVENAAAEGVNIECELIGERPCMGNVDKDKEQFLLDRALSALKSEWWSEAGYRFEGNMVPGSTDCNITLSKGIPSICFGLAYSEGHHTLSEFTRLDSLLPGMKTLIKFVTE